MELSQSPRFKYQNGNATVSLFKDGTRIIEWPDGEEKQLDFPCHMDLKITNYCDNPHCVKYCHEKSNKLGTHSEWESLMGIFGESPTGQEIAIGGGNPMAHPSITEFLQELKGSGLVANMTVNQFHLQWNAPRLNTFFSDELLNGLGVSVINVEEIIKDSFLYELNGHYVFHLIAGIHSIDDAKRIIDKYPKCRLLVLGYKTFGNGVKFYDKNTQEIQRKLYRWYVELHTLLNNAGHILIFDNLAVEQLKPDRFFVKNDWSELYQGDDADGSLYLDFCKKEYAPSSRSSIRFPLDSKTSLKDAMKKAKDSR